MKGKHFVIQGHFEYTPVPLSYFTMKTGFSKKDVEEIKKLDIGEFYDLDTCSKCGVGKGERVIWRVV